MKIECPDCRLSGNVNEVEIPDEGRNISCPRCKTVFHVAKPPLPAAGRYLMNNCPVCQYSTFTDEMFAVCPKCGHSGKYYGKTSSKREDTVNTQRQEQQPLREDKDQLMRDLDALNRSYRNPDLVRAPERAVAEQFKAPQPVRWTGWSCVVAGTAFLIYGLAGLLDYYTEDWRAILSEPLLEPLSRTRVFFALAFLPWLRTLFGIWFIVAASRFLRLQSRALRELAWCARSGLALGIISEIAGFVDWAKISSSSPTMTYYAVGILSSLFMVLLWCIPSLALILYLRSKAILQAFPNN